MENKKLHHRKVAILSRLVKESSLTLEEALLLLKTEDVQESVQPAWFGTTTTPYTIPHGNGFTTISSGNSTGVSVNTSGSTSFTTSPSNATFTADLNN